jgi:tellurite resistance protein TerC
LNVPVSYWTAFAVFVTTMLTLDLFVFHRKSHEPTLRESAWWTLFWCGLAGIFGGLIYYANSIHPEYFASERNPYPKPTTEFFTGYIVEWALSVDNVFVFAVVFGHFRVPLKYQYRVLFWGILGAIIMRLVFILAGSALLHYAEWMMPIFGAFLIYTGVKLAFKEDEEVHPENNWLMKTGRKLFNVTTEPSGDKFFRKIDGKFFVTPLFLVLLVIESTDVIFAVDSVPAILSITQDTFIVFTSNIFAIMGLRALYFLLAGVMDMFRFLNYGLSAILVFVGGKMAAEYFSKTAVWETLFNYKLVEKIDPETGRTIVPKLIDPMVSLIIVVSILALSILASVVIPKKPGEDKEPVHVRDADDGEAQPVLPHETAEHDGTLTQEPGN